jgi:hypothetical protein
MHVVTTLETEARQRDKTPTAAVEGDQTGTQAKDLQSAPIQQLSQPAAKWDNAQMWHRESWQLIVPDPDVRPEDTVALMSRILTHGLQHLSFNVMGCPAPSADHTLKVFFYCGLTNGTYVVFHMKLAPTGTTECVIKIERKDQNLIQKLLQYLKSHTQTVQPSDQTSAVTEADEPADDRSTAAGWAAAAAAPATNDASDDARTEYLPPSVTAPAVPVRAAYRSALSLRSEDELCCTEDTVEY